MKMKINVLLFLSLLLMAACAPKEQTAAAPIAENITDVANNASVSTNTSNDLPILSVLRKGAFYRVEEVDAKKIIDKANISYQAISITAEHLTIDIPGKADLSKKMTKAITKSLIESSNCASCQTYEDFIIHVAKECADISEDISFELSYDFIAEDLYPEYVSVQGHWHSSMLHGAGYTPEFSIKLDGKTGNEVASVFNVAEEEVLAEIKKLYNKGLTYNYDEGKKGIELKKLYKQSSYGDCRFEGAEESDYPAFSSIKDVNKDYVIFTYNFCDYQKNESIGMVAKNELAKYLTK